MPEDEDEDLYALLGLDYGSEPSQKAIQRAYRLKALTCHPDKVGPDDQEAAALFHRLSKAIETLLDSDKKSKYDQTYKAKLAQKQRIQQMDAQRRRARDSLLAKEQEAAAQRKKSHQPDSDPLQQLHRIKEQEQLRKRAMEEHWSRTTALLSSGGGSVSASSLDMMDVALRVKWRHEGVTRLDLERIFASFGPIDSIIMSSAASTSSSSSRSLSHLDSTKKPKKSSAMVIFKSLKDARSAMEASKTSLKLFDVQWASGKEPPAVEKQDPSSQSSTTSRTTAPTSTSKLDDYEAITLLKMKQAAEQRKKASSSSS